MSLLRNLKKKKEIILFSRKVVLVLCAKNSACHIVGAQ